TEGIATIPAFSLGKPAIMGSLSFYKKRFGFDQYLAYSIDGKPWFIESYLNYKVLDGEKFDFAASTMWGASYSYQEVFSDGGQQVETDYQRYVFLIFSTIYELTEKTSVGVSSYHGYGFPEGSIRWATFVSVKGSLSKWAMGRSLYARFYPEVLYINLDWGTDAFFAAGKFGVGIHKVPLFLSTQGSQYLTGNLTPNPGFRWNIGVSYEF
ncbi:MAG: hypothetical protein HKN31_14420, partial [Pricia sp.]|nr:hypothetical protein [Pricia sp.]